MVTPVPTTSSTGSSTSGDETTSLAMSTEPVIEPTTSTSTGDETTSTSSTEDSGDSSDDTGPVPVTCWEQGASGWMPGVGMMGLAGGDPDNGTLSGDGLTLYYVADQTRRLYRAKRASRTDPFLGGQPELWPNFDDIRVDHPTATAGGVEILFHYWIGEGMMATPGKRLKYTVAAVNPNDQYSGPENVNGLGGQDGPNDEIPAISADGRVLLVQRRDGSDIPGFGPGWAFRQYKREAPQPGSPWTEHGAVTPENGALNFALCPALSPDGLRLLYTSTSEAVLTMQNVNNVMGVWSTQRTDVNSKFDPPVELAAYGEDGGISCPRAVTDDGCTLLYTRFAYGESDGQGMFLGERGP